MAVGLYPPDAALAGPAQTNRVVWRADGSVSISGSDAASVAQDYVAGDTLTFRLDAAGTTLTLLKNGSVVGSYAIAALSRVPSVVSIAAGADITINGAPTGETPWA